MVKAISSGFFPGSLGNYAGQERGIPTLTLELPSADPKKAPDYWNIFKTGMTKVVQFEVPPLDTIRAAK
jgi:protein MpaA